MPPTPPNPQSWHSLLHAGQRGDVGRNLCPAGRLETQRFPTGRWGRRSSRPQLNSPVTGLQKKGRGRVYWEGEEVQGCPRSGHVMHLPSRSLHLGSRSASQPMPALPREDIPASPSSIGSPHTTPGWRLSSFQNKPALTAVRHPPRQLPLPGQGCVCARALPGVPAATRQSASLEARAWLPKLSQPDKWDPYIPQPPKLGPCPHHTRPLTESHCIMPH